jgi:hypothetical protein
MKNLFALSFLLISAVLFSQDKGALQGQITDLEMNGDPLLFANVSLKNTLLNEQTNLHGNFNISDIAPGSYTMVVSYLGYEDLEFQVLIEADKTTFVQKGLYAKRIDLESLMQAELPVSNNSGGQSASEGIYK